MAAACLDGIDGILLDINGVLHVDGVQVDGGPEALERLAGSGLALHCLTNTTTRTRQDLAAMLDGIGYKLTAEQITSTVSSCVNLLRHRGHQRIWPIAAEDILTQFDDFDRDEERPDAVIIGDIGPAWDHELLDRAFCCLDRGSEIVALHRNATQTIDGERHIDIGCYVAALEAAADRQATIVGKPSPACFESALGELDLDQERVLMVGDDIDSDIGGAQACGLRAALVRTGKFDEDRVAASEYEPDAVIDSIAALPELLQR